MLKTNSYNVIRTCCVLAVCVCLSLYATAQEPGELTVSERKSDSDCKTCPKDNEADALKEKTSNKEKLDANAIKYEIWVIDERIKRMKEGKPPEVTLGTNKSKKPETIEDLLKRKKSLEKSLKKLTKTNPKLVED